MSLCLSAGISVAGHVEAETRTPDSRGTGSTIARPDDPLHRAEEEFTAARYEQAARLYALHLQDHPADGDARVRLGWCRYRLGDVGAARDVFLEALYRDPRSDDARVGLGYALLQTEGPAAARTEFRRVLAGRADHGDALRGIILAARRAPRDGTLIAEGIDAANRLLRIDPSDRDAIVALTELEGARDAVASEPLPAGASSGGRAQPRKVAERRLRPTPAKSAPLRLPSRAGKDYLEVRTSDGTWQPVFIKGINMGLALPGRFPTEFPTEDQTYAEWFDTIASLGINTVRAYTLLPPAFYRALAGHNAARDSRRLWLIQGVWTELPAGHDFSDAGFLADFESEIARVIDAVHGNVVVAARPGHASGLYDTDVSDSLLAAIIGREWEPFAVLDYDNAHPEQTAWDGKWFRTRGGRAMECWVARVCDFAAGYEAGRYRMLHPLTFANWPTLDPIVHPTETTRSEEDAWRRKYGFAVPGKLREAPWEDDAVSLDSTRVIPTEEMKAGFFASYHVYPNFPDFLNLDPAYDTAGGTRAPSRYASYLRDLKRYHGDQPVVVAEFGISTSRGIAHLQPEGWHHGGSDERRQGELVSTMLRQIFETGCAGGIVFEFMDEWFKGTWSVASFQIPSDRRRLWFNAESPEQSYGLFAARPGPATGGIRLDGKPGDWDEVPILASATDLRARKDGRDDGGWKKLREIRAASDEGYLYLLIRTAGGPEPPDWRKTAFRIAIDTYDPNRGERKLPPPAATEVPTGVEFIVDLAGADRSFVTVAEPYEPYSHRDLGPFASPLASSGRFVHLEFETNRERIGRDGTRFPARRVDRGVLRYGTLDPTVESADTRSDVAIGSSTGTIELRLPWAILNVTDPSSHRVLHQVDAHEPPYGTVETDGFRIYAFAVNPSKPARGPADELPGSDRVPKAFLWPAWESPRYRLEPKRSVEEIRNTMMKLPDHPDPRFGRAKETKNER